LIGKNGAGHVRDGIETRTGTDYVAPRTELERKLCEIWRDHLQVERVGVNDDFFALRGHSLLAVRLFASIERDLQVALPVVTIFQAGTVAELAKVLAEKANTKPSRLMPIQPAERGGLYF
jgi:acyl carrier protein